MKTTLFLSGITRIIRPRDIRECQLDCLLTFYELWSKKEREKEIGKILGTIKKLKRRANRGQGK